MSKQAWHFGAPERNPAELAEESERRRAEDRAERRELLLLRAELTARSPEMSRSATPAATPAVPEMCSEDLGLPAAA